MFLFAQDGCVRWPVTIEQVQADNSIAEQTVVITYERLTRAARRDHDARVMDYTAKFRALLPAEGEDDTAENAAARQQLNDEGQRDDDALLRQRVKGWSGIADQDGKPLAFGADLLEAFINDELLRTVLLRGLLAASAGAPLKNSLPGLAGRPVPAQA